MAVAGLVEAVERRIADALLERVSGFAASTVVETYEAVVPRDEGTLASAFRFDVFPVRDGVVRLHGEVDDDVAPHGKWINDPPAEIVPVHGAVLHWFSKSTGEDVFARRVVPSRVHAGWWPRFVDRIVDLSGGR